MTQRILDKINQDQEEDVEPYTLETIPESLFAFWEEYFTN